MMQAQQIILRDEYGEGQDHGQYLGALDRFYWIAAEGDQQHVIQKLFVAEISPPCARLRPWKLARQAALGEKLRVTGVKIAVRLVKPPGAVSAHVKSKAK